MLAVALTALAGEAVRGYLGEGSVLPLLWLMSVCALGFLAYFLLLFKYMRRRDGLVHSKGEVRWGQQLLAQAPMGSLIERGSRLDVSPHLQAWLKGVKIAKFEDLAPFLIDRDRDAYLKKIETLRLSQVEFDMNVMLAAHGTHASRPLYIVGQCVDHTNVLWLRDISSVRAKETEWQADRAMHESEIAKLTTIVEALPRPIWLRRITGQIIWCNTAYAKAMESSRDTVIEKQMEFAAQSRYTQARDLARRAVEADSVQTEDRRVVVDGTRKLFRIIETPVMMEGYIVGVAFDQTEFEEAKEEIKRHRASFEETLEQLATPMAIFEADHTLQFSNQAYVRLWQFDESFLKTKPTYGDMLENLRERRKIPEVVDFQRWKREQIGQFTSLLHAAEEMLHLPDGTTIRQIIIPHPLGGLMFVTEDVTDKLQLESSYNTLIAVQSETLNNLAEGIVVLGSDGRVKLYNPAYARIWQLDEAALEVSPHITEILEQIKVLAEYEGEWNLYRQQVAAQMLNREALTERISRTDRSIIEHNSVPLPDGNILHSFLDVSDSVRVEQALRETNKALAAADRLKSEFVANVSYQLRTPLSTIIGFAEILTNQYFGELNERQLDYSRTILDASRKLLTLINTVLDLATIEAGRMLLNRRSVAISKIMNEGLDMVQAWATRQQITVKMNVPDGTFEVDERRMQQVLFNLLTNAVQYTPPGGRILIDGKRTEDMVTITIKDTGIGMSAEEQARVFNKFERANPQARQPGVGLGLSLVKSLIDLHGGTLSLASSVDEGTTVTFQIPTRVARPQLDEAV